KSSTVICGCCSSAMATASSSVSTRPAMRCRAGASGVWAFTVRGEPTESKMATALAIRRVVIGEVTVLLRCRPAREYHERLTSPAFAPAWTRWATCGFTVDDVWIHGGRSVDTFLLDDP